MGTSQEQIAGLRRLSDNTPDGRIEVGPKEPYLAPLERINMVSQVRQEIGVEEMQELVRSLTRERDDGSKYIGLIQPITLGHFNSEQLEAYLTRLNATWNSNHQVGDLVPLIDDGDTYLIVIAGHRRTLGIKAAAEEIDQGLSVIDVVFHLKDGNHLTFREAITTQYRENSHKRPESWEDARAIIAILHEGMPER